jgi:phage shock protein PspC (stress-responsive transcriptional regulator)
MDKLQSFLEKNAFGVCEYLGEKFGLSILSIRKFFIYSSFIAFGSPVILYLILAFFIENYKIYKAKKHSIWDL